MTSQPPLEGVVVPADVVRVPEDPKERELADAIAIGYTWNDAAQLAGYSRRQVARLVKVLRPYIEWRRRHLPSETETKAYANIALAFDVQRLMLSGQIDAEDKRYLEAKQIVRDFMAWTLYVERPTRPTAADRTLEPDPPLLRLEEAAS